MGTHRVILCEGFDDRSFWAGWLQHLDCTDPTNRGKIKARDANNRPVQGQGRYLYRTPTEHSSIEIRPYEGRSNLAKTVRDYLKIHRGSPIDRMILSLDSDAEIGLDQSAADQISGIAASHDSQVQDPQREFFDLEGIKTSAVIWECLDEDPIPGVPQKQTLERLVAASIRAAYPARGPTVEGWLAATPHGEDAITHKNYGYSYLAKWYAKHKADDFFRELWRDEAVAAQLRERLEARGAWAKVEDLVAD